MVSLKSNQFNLQKIYKRFTAPITVFRVGSGFSGYKRSESLSDIYANCKNYIKSLMPPTMMRALFKKHVISSGFKNEFNGDDKSHPLSKDQLSKSRRKRRKLLGSYVTHYVEQGEKIPTIIDDIGLENLTLTGLGVYFIDFFIKGIFNSVIIRIIEDLDSLSSSFILENLDALFDKNQLISKRLFSGFLLITLGLIAASVYLGSLVATPIAKAINLILHWGIIEPLTQFKELMESIGDSLSIHPMKWLNHLYNALFSPKTSVAQETTAKIYQAMGGDKKTLTAATQKPRAEIDQKNNDGLIVDEAVAVETDFVINIIPPHHVIPSAATTEPSSNATSNTPSAIQSPRASETSPRSSSTSENVECLCSIFATMNALKNTGNVALGVDFTNARKAQVEAMKYRITQAINGPQTEQTIRFENNQDVTA